MRSRFENELKKLGDELTEMGTMIEQAIQKACLALETRDIPLARAVFSGDIDVDKKERQIESLCMRLLLQEQPVAGDLRLVSAAIRMICDMERIGDQAQDIAEIVTFYSDGEFIKEPEHIRQMAQITMRMTRESIDAFVCRDLNQALAIYGQDDEVDALFATVKSDLADILIQDRGKVGGVLDLLMIAKYFERIGDHAVNIAEWVEYAMTGIHKGVRIE